MNVVLASGRVTYCRSTRDDCICCDGHHVVGRFLVGDDGQAVDVQRALSHGLTDMLLDPSLEGEFVEIVIRVA